MAELGSSLWLLFNSLVSAKPPLFKVHNNDRSPHVPPAAAEGSFVLCSDTAAPPGAA